MACKLTDNTIQLEGNTEYSGHLNGFGDVDTYKFTITENETITFRINIVNTGAGTLPDATLKLFRLYQGDEISLGTSFLQRQLNVFNYDGVVGDYYFCLENLYNCDYTLLVEFTDYNGIIFDRMYCYSGEEMDGAWPPIVIPPCDLQVAYEIVKGELPLDITNKPEKFTFESSGIIYGTPGEQDCESGEFETPSWNWKEYKVETGLHPLSKSYPITVRAYFVYFPYVYVDKELEICVHNNWDFDQPDFENLTKTVYDVSYIDVEENPNELCPPCIETKKVITERLVNFNSVDIDNLLNQLARLSFEKQCEMRHKNPELTDTYLLKEPEKSEIELCPICPTDK